MPTKSRMMKLEHEFVEFIPKELEHGKLYISIRFKTALHLCACGCGIKTVTPLSPTDWKLIFNGKSVSLNPSIGNWQFPCGSHYWITKSKVIWSHNWTMEEVYQNRKEDKARKKLFFENQSEVKKVKNPWWKCSWLFRNDK